MKKLLYPFLGVVVVLVIYFISVKKEKTEQQIQQKIEAQKKLKEKETILKDLSNIITIASQAKENNDLNKLKSLKDMLIKMKLNKKYQNVSETIDSDINQIDTFIEEVRNNIKLQNYNKKRKLCLEQLNFYLVEIDNYNLNQLQNLKYKIKDMIACKDYINNEIQDAIQKINNKIHNIQTQEENFKNYCLNTYDELEKEYQDAKGIFNDDENQIADVKTKAIKLRNEGCDKYLGNSLNELIKKCDSDL